MKQLIDLSIENKELQEALQDITEFKLGSLNKFTAEDFNELEAIGFKFSTKAVTQRKSEMRLFVNEHPECQSGDFTTMVEKITYYTLKKQQLKRKKQKKTTEKTRKVILDTARSFTEHDVPDVASRRSRTPRCFPLIYEPESSTEEESN